MTGQAESAVRFSVAINDPGGAYASYHSAITSNLVAAGDDWGSHFRSYDATVALQVNFTNEATMSGSSAWSRAVGTRGTQTIIQQGAAAKLMGFSNPGGSFDAVVNIGTSGYLQNTLWFDPNPASRTTPVPANKTDAFSRFLHEIGHILVFNGELDRTTGGSVGGSFISTYDQFVVSRTETINGTDYVTPYFTGSNARALYGADVPLTYGNYTHVGNSSPRPGTDLISFQTLELMNGITTYESTRYDISALDLAIVRDSGLTTTVPEPAGLFWAAAAMVGGLSRRSRRSRSLG